MNSKTNVTSLVKFGEVDGDSLPLERCICGQEFDGWKGPILFNKEENPSTCDSCGRRYCFSNSITVYLIDEE